MRLYATVTSERATKGQGGNDYLQIILTAGNKTRREVGKLDMSIEPSGEVIIDFTAGSGEIARLLAGTYPDKTKGRYQKGEN